MGHSFAGKILVFPGAKGSPGWSVYFHTARLAGAAPLGMIFKKMTTKVALGAVVTRVPSVTDLDQDPLAVIATGDWVKIDADNGIVEITKRPSGPGAPVVLGAQRRLAVRATTRVCQPQGCDSSRQPFGMSLSHLRG